MINKPPPRNAESIFPLIRHEIDSAESRVAKVWWLFLVPVVYFSLAVIFWSPDADAARLRHCWPSARQCRRHSRFDLTHFFLQHLFFGSLFWDFLEHLSSLTNTEQNKQNTTYMFQMWFFSELDFLNTRSRSSDSELTPLPIFFSFSGQDFLNTRSRSPDSELTPLPIFFFCGRIFQHRGVY